MCQRAQRTTSLDLQRAIVADPVCGVRGIASHRSRSQNPKNQSQKIDICFS
jgi:hypothetical protein